MKGAKKASETSRSARMPMPIYYNTATKTVYTRPGEGRCHVTDLIRENSEQEIEEAVRRWLWM